MSVAQGGIKSAGMTAGARQHGAFAMPLARLRRPRVWKDGVYNEPVDGASGRLAGTSDCSAAQFSAAVADQNICNQSCGNKHMDMLNLLLG